MHRRSFLGSLAMLPLARAALAAALSPQDQADILRIQAYLNGMGALKARFVQTAPNGTVDGGTAWLERPGRMRFEYDPPSPLLLVAGHGLVVFHDARLQQTSNIPLSATPLGILLAADVKLSGAVTVTGVVRQQGQIRITLARTSAPGDGTLTLGFTDQPLALRQWTVTDASRKETTVVLTDVQPGGPFDSGLFSYVDPKALGGGGVG